MNSVIIELVGWTGTFFVVLAYFLVSNKKIEPASKEYQLLNLFGALGISVNVWHHQAWPSFALQIVWGTIALVALVKIAKSSRNHSNQ